MSSSLRLVGVIFAGEPFAFMLVLRFLLRVYKAVLSPALALLTGGPGSGCRFVPTCSEYMVEAIERHGWMRGCYLGLRRLCRCHPWGGSGFDPVPEKTSSLSRSH